ncbi:MAG TPA: hypothetical protein VHU83_21870 [Bryobacteraceae bacterium]|jgi:hypothetical protein|nr:hypothetical protein [Bryobacteraceae bacterium]
MKILMICKGEYYGFMPLIAETLKRQYGHSIDALTFATPTAELPCMRVYDQVYNQAAYLKQHVPHYDLDECVKYLQQLEFSGELAELNVITYADRIIRQYPFERVIKIVAGVCRFWEELLRNAQPDAIVGEVACASEWIAWSLSRRLGIQYLIPYPGPLPRRFYFVRSPAGGWDAAEAVYRDVKNRALTSNQIRVAEDFLTTFRQTRLRSAIHAPAFRSPVRIDRSRIEQLTKRAKRVPFRVRTYLEDGHFEVGSYNGRPPWEPIWKDLRRIIRHLGQSRAFETAIAPGPKVYFPLHVQPEFTIDVRAPFCTNQLALIENIAKSIPSGYRLVVKDHPGMRGLRPAHYYRDLKKLYNVQLVSPAIDSHCIIQASDALLTIVGTTAWEGILYEKPVIAFGPLGYKFFDLLYSCETISELPSILSNAIHGYKPNYDLLLKFIWAMLETAHQGEWHDPLATPAVLDPANIESIAKCIVGEIETQKKQRRALLAV